MISYLVYLELLNLVLVQSALTANDCLKAAKAETYLETATELIEKLRDNLKDETSCECAQKPMDCSQLATCGHNVSGVYKIWPRNRIMEQSVDVYCDMETEGGGWTVIQRRGDFKRPLDYFSKNWHKYKTGFGDIRKDFWLGNDNIYALTNQMKYNLLVELKDVNNLTKSANYDQFWIDSEEHSYLLRAYEYSGNAGDALSALNGHPFSTPDRLIVQCPDALQSGWWYKDCTLSNPNGLYQGPSEVRMSWATLSDIPLKAIEMKIRPYDYFMYDLSLEVDAV